MKYCPWCNKLLHIKDNLDQICLSDNHFYFAHPESTDEATFYGFLFWYRFGDHLMSVWENEKHIKTLKVLNKIDYNTVTFELIQNLLILN